MIYNLRTLDPTVESIYKGLLDGGYLSLVQKFPYDSLRFNEVVEEKLVPLGVLFSISNTLLRRINHLEGKGF